MLSKFQSFLRRFSTNLAFKKNLNALANLKIKLIRPLKINSLFRVVRPTVFFVPTVIFFFFFFARARRHAGYGLAATKAHMRMHMTRHVHAVQVTRQETAREKSSRVQNPGNPYVRVQTLLHCGSFSVVTEFWFAFQSLVETQSAFLFKFFSSCFGLGL